MGRTNGLFQERGSALVAVTILLQVLLLFRSVTVSGAKSSSNQVPTFPLQGIGSDPFVEASPLVLGVVCQDGVLLVAVHSIFSETNEESSLLWSNHQEETEETGDDSSFVNLPRSYRGPFRIHSLGEKAAMVCAGWRTDGAMLADHLRSVDRSENIVFGGGNEKGGDLANAASLFLARSMVSEGRRSLSCVGLLASQGGLWVVDATGAYAVRAHALGVGSETINQLLRSRGVGKDWKTLPHTAVQKELIQQLFSTNQQQDDKKNSSSIHKLPKGCRVEMALVQAVQSNEAQENPGAVPTSKKQQTRTSMKRLF